MKTSIFNPAILPKEEEVKYSMLNCTPLNSNWIKPVINKTIRAIMPAIRNFSDTAAIRFTLSGCFLIPGIKARIRNNIPPNHKHAATIWEKTDSLYIL